MLINYYKKVFLALLRFSFLEGLFSSFLGGVGAGGASGLLGGLFGGSDKSELNASDIIRQIEADKDRAGGAGDTRSSIPLLESIPESIGKNIGDFGKNMATEFTSKLAERFVSSKVDRLISGKPKSPVELGLRDKAYTSARYPNVNPWELAGAGGAQGGAQAGQAIAKSQQDTQRDVSRIGASSARRVADIHAEPALKEVKAKYYESPRTQAEISHVEAEKDLIVSQKGKVQLETKWIPALSKAEMLLRGSKGAQAMQQAGLIMKQIKTETNRTDLVRENAKLQGVFAEFAEWIAL